MVVPISPWLVETTPSPTLAFKAKADALRERGVKIYDFGVGEINSPDIPCPPEVIEELTASARAGELHYTLAAGDAETRGHIAADLRNNFGLTYGPDCIAVCNGPKDAIYKVLVAVLAGRGAGEKRRVACFAPFYESFVAAPQLITGIGATVLASGADGLPDPTSLAVALADAAMDIGVVIICTPNNPTGQVYPRQLLEKIAAVCQRHPDVLVISDETYRTVVYSDVSSDGALAEHWSIAQVLPQQAVVVAGMSKELAGTGLRIGFVAGPQHVIDAVAAVQGNASSCAVLPAAKAYGRVLARDRSMDIRRGITQQLAERRSALLAGFRRWVPEARWDHGYTPQGAYYFFPSLQRYIGRTVQASANSASVSSIADDAALADYMLESAGVVCIPGSCFGMPGHFRFAYARMRPEDITAGVEAMGKALAALAVTEPASSL